MLCNDDELQPIRHHVIFTSASENLCTAAEYASMLNKPLLESSNKQNLCSKSVHRATFWVHSTEIHFDQCATLYETYLGPCQFLPSHQTSAPMADNPVKLKGNHIFPDLDALKSFSKEINTCYISTSMVKLKIVCLIFTNLTFGISAKSLEINFILTALFDKLIGDHIEVQISQLEVTN